MTKNYCVGVLSFVQYFLHMWELYHFIVMQKIHERMFYLKLVL